MKTSTPPTTNVVKFNKVSQYELAAQAEVQQSINDKLSLITVNFKLNAAQFALLRRLAIEEVNSLRPADATPEARKAYLADEAKRKATGKDSRTYEQFLCSYKTFAKKRYALISEGKTAEADVQLEMALNTLNALEALNTALTQRTK